MYMEEQSFIVTEHESVGLFYEPNTREWRKWNALGTRCERDQVVSRQAMRSVGRLSHTRAALRYFIQGGTMGPLLVPHVPKS